MYVWDWKSGAPAGANKVTDKVILNSIMDGAKIVHRCTLYHLMKMEVTLLHLGFAMSGIGT
jgi:hypothetical protein